MEQLHKIFKLCGSPSENYWKKEKLHHSTAFKPLHPYRRRLGETFKDFPPSAVRLMDTLLSIDPELRGTAVGALESEVSLAFPCPCVSAINLSLMLCSLVRKRWSNKTEF